MSALDPLALGIALITLAILIAGVVVFVAHRRRRVKSSVPAAGSDFDHLPTQQANDQAVLLVQAGGRIVYSNAIAREWFGYRHHAPNLERLARRASPGDVFLGLCATEGQARFLLDGRLVEAVSYPVPLARDQAAAMLVTLRRLKLTRFEGYREEGQLAETELVSEISQAVSSSLELDSTLFAILTNLGRVFPADYSEVTIWDQANACLVPYHLAGATDVDRRLVKADLRYRPGEGYSGYLITSRQPLLISDVESFRLAQPAVERNQLPLSSYLGIPLFFAQELIGTVELAALAQDRFTQSDLEALQRISGQMAIALHNALLYQDLNKQMLELSGLAKLAQASEVQQDPVEFYTRLIAGITPLVQAESIGFLIYDEQRRRLAAQPPFLGIPPEFVHLYQVLVPPGSPGEEIWLAAQMIVADQAPQDPRLTALGLAGLAQAAGLTNIVLAPLTSAGRMLGYLHVADKLDGSQFSPDDLRILSSIAGQAAPVIDNLLLVRQAQERALRSEALRRIASLTGSVATLDEILTFALRELAHYLRVDLGMILLVDENRAELRPHLTSLFGITEDVAARLGRLSMNAPEYSEMVTREQHPIFCDELSSQPALPSTYRLMADVLGLQAMIVVPVIIRQRAIGEIILASQHVEHFDPFDLILLSTAASLMASAIEKEGLITQTDESLQRRVEQLMALTRINQQLNTTLELKPILMLVYDELLRTTQAACGTIALYEPVGNIHGERQAFIQIGDEAAETLSPLETVALAFEEPIIIPDYAQPIPQVGNAHLDPPHPGVASSLIVPISYQEDIAGLIHLHSPNVEFFDQTTVEIAQTLATQAAIALGNTSRFYEQRRRTEMLNQRVETIGKLVETTKLFSPDQPLAEGLEAIAYAIQEATPFNLVIISIYEPETGSLWRIAGAGIPLDEMDRLRAEPWAWTSLNKHLKDEYRHNSAYFVPSDGGLYEPLESNTDFLVSMGRSRSAEQGTWLAGDGLYCVLRDPQDTLIGIVQVDQPRDGARPDIPTLDALELFASQAGMIIETHHRLDRLTSQLNITQEEFRRIISVQDASPGESTSLLAREAEIDLAYRDRDQGRKAVRIQAGLDIAELVNRQKNRLDVFRVFSQAMLNWIGYDLALVAEQIANNPRLVHGIGLPSAQQTNLDALLGQRNPLKACMQSGEMLLVNDLDQVDEWQGVALLSAVEAKAFVSLPIVNAGKVEAVTLFASRQAQRPFTADEKHLFEVLCRQVGIAIENTRLLSETNRRLYELDLLLKFTRQLGALDLLSILRLLVESALKVVPHANAGMVALWQEEQGSLVPQAATGYLHPEHIMQISYQSGQALPGLAYQHGETLRVDEVDFAQDYNMPPEHLMRYRDATEGQLPISTLVVPIGTSEVTLGVVVLDNFREPAAFSAEDQNLVSALARQTAITLENARLYQAVEQRATQLFTLTNVAATITSSLRTDDLIDSLLGQVREIVPYDTGTLWLRQGDLLTVRAAAGFEDSDQRLGLTAAVEDSLLLKEMIGTSLSISVGDVRADPRFPALLEPRYLSWLGVPLISKGQVVGVIALEKEEANYFTNNTVDAMVTFAAQAAVALENARLYEESVRRAAELDERSQRLTLLNRLSTELSGSLELSTILDQTMRELAQAVRCDAISVVLFDEKAQPFLAADQPKFEDDYPQPLPESPIFERLHETFGIFTTDDVEAEADFGELNDFLTKRATRGLLIVPLATGSLLHGVLLVHASQPRRFDVDQVELARTVGNQAAVAIQNARLFQETERLFAETQQHSAELGALFELGVNITQVLDRERLIEAAFENVSRMLGADTTGLVLLGPADTLELRALDKGERIGPVSIIRGGASFSEYVLKTGAPLFIRDLDQELDTLPVKGYTLGEQVKSWVGVPLNVRGATMGVLSAQAYHANTFSQTQVRLLGQVGNQLAVALDNARLFETAQAYAADMAQRVSERTQELETEHHRSQTLLRIITELSASLDLDMVLNRTLAILNETIWADQSIIVLVDPDSGELYLRAYQGGAQPALFAGRTSVGKKNQALAQWVVARREALLIPDLLDDDRWPQVSDEYSQNHSAIAVPLMMGEESLGALLLYHWEANRFTLDGLELAQAAARQIAVSINNSQLFNLIRDQAERLGDMLRTQHVETSRSQAMLEAVADGVLVTDANRVITLFNASAQKILQLSRDQVVGRSLENFIGLFGKAASDWVQTIRYWSENPASFQAGESKSEQIVLDDRRVVSVHLSPVLLKNDFLGTVSIFQDITHLVELDRLKSEFVATVSHELRTPMTSIKGYVEVLLMGAAGSLSEQQTHFLQVVRANTERLAILVNDLLDVSRIEAGKVTLSMQPIEPLSIIHATMDMITRRSQDEGKPMSFHFEADPTMPPAYGDRDRVQQVLDNLVQNAYQYTPENGNIWVTAQVNGAEVQFNVQDDGIGIPHEDQPRVFERFFRGEHPLVLGTSGTGLGLSIVSHLVEMHGGRIWFTSPGAQGLGSVFSFTIPLYNAEDSASNAPMAPVEIGERKGVTND